MTLKNATIEQLWQWHADIVDEIQRRTLGVDERAAPRAPWESIPGAASSAFVDYDARSGRAVPREPRTSLADVRRARMQREEAKAKAAAMAARRAENPELFDEAPPDDEDGPPASPDEVHELAMARAADLERRILDGEDVKWPAHLPKPDATYLRAFEATKPRRANESRQIAFVDSKTGQPIPTNGRSG